ncbi:MAG: hypothetical protein O3A20_05565 [Planctomycetota bacterium]|nr:hypothetical protein [Planctomycetota bacterium]
MFRPSPLRTLLTVAVALVAFCATVAAQSTTRSSLSTLGAEGDLASGAPSLSANGQFIAFSSDASTLVSGDTNGVSDVFLHDRVNGTTIRVSVTSAGLEGTGASSSPMICSDARFIVFESAATDLVPNDNNGALDIFIHDRLSGITQRISLSSTNQEGNGDSTHSQTSADGRYVTFQSMADNLVGGDNNAARDVFVRDLLTGVTRRASVNTAGVEGDAASCEPSISDDARFVAFRSAATNLAAGDTNGLLDIFVHDVLRAETTLVSDGISSAQSNGDSQHPSISASGRYVAFESIADNLAAGDANLSSDVFVRDRLSGVTERVSLNSSGVEGNLASHAPEISPGGRYVTFTSFADDLVAGDLNGVSDAFCRDRLRGATTRVSVDSFDVEGDGASSHASISADCRYVAFESASTNLVGSDLNAVADVFVRDRGAAAAVSVDTIVLSCEIFLTAGVSTRLAWCNAPVSTPWWLLYSPNNIGTSFSSHPFGVGPGVTVLASGANNSEGTGSLVSPPIPQALSGQTIYLELASRLGSGFFESNTIERFVQ